MDSMNEIRIRAPDARGCPECGSIHSAEQPHDRDSLYYQYRFYRRNRRFPTWQDAMAHCSDDAKQRCIAELRARGINPEEEHGMETP